MGKRKHQRQEKTMEAPQQPNADILATLAADAASSSETDAPNQATNEADTSAREAAALEERLQAERIAQMKQAGLEAEKGVVAAVDPQEPLASVAARGRDALLARMRQHEEMTRNKPSYVPPPLTDRQREKLEAEMAAGRKAVERHTEQLAHRPPRAADPIKEGFNTPVHRPGLAVPDPKANDVRPGQTNNKGVYSPDK